MDKSSTNDQIMKPISIDPEEITFQNVQQSQTYTLQLHVANNMKFYSNIVVKWSCTDRIEIKPREFRLAPQKSQIVDITLRMNKPFAEKNGVKVPIKEFLFIKSENFDQKLRLTINPEKPGALPGKYFTNSSCDYDNEDSQQIITNEDFEDLIEDSRRQGRAQDYESYPRDDDCECEETKEGQYMRYNTESAFEGVLHPEPSNYYPSAFKSSTDKRTQRDEAENFEALHSTIDQLTQKCKNLEMELMNVQNQRSHIDEIKSILNEKEPNLQRLVDVAMKQEKHKNEQKSLKVLQILKAKDKTIESLTQKFHQYSQSSAELHNNIQQFEMYKQKCQQEIDQKFNLFRLNNTGKDVESIVEYKQEIDKLRAELQEKVEEANNYSIVVATLEEKSQTLLTALEHTRTESKAKDDKMGELHSKIKELETKGKEQETQVNKLVEKIADLTDDNRRSQSERSKSLEKGENYVTKISILTEEINSLKRENNQLDKECNSVKEIHLGFLEACNNAINPDIKIGEDYDIEFVQNGILSNIKDMHESIVSYQHRHREDQDCLKHMEQEIYKIQHKLAGKSYSTKVAQTEFLGEDLDDITNRISQLEAEYDKAMDENDNLRGYVKELEHNIDTISQERDHYKQECDNPHNKKHVKSTTSLTYSVDDDQAQNEFRRTSSIKQISKQDCYTSSPTFRIDDKENLDANSSVYTGFEPLNSYRTGVESHRNPNIKKVKISQIKNLNKNTSLHELSNAEIKSKETQIIIVEQRREIEELQKQNASLESKLNFDMKEKNQIINRLETQIESLNQINNKLKCERSSKLQDKDNLEHYAEKLELNEVTMKGRLQELTKEKEYLEEYNAELIEDLKVLQEVNISLKNKLQLDEVLVDEENTLSILSSKVSQQKKEIRELKGSLEKMKDKYENLLLQLNQRNRETSVFENNLLQSQLSCSLGLSTASRGRDLTPIESLVHQNRMGLGHEASLADSIQSSIRKGKLTKKKDTKARGLDHSDLEISIHQKAVAKDDNYLVSSHHSIPGNDNLVKWLQAQGQQKEKLIQHLASELQTMITKNGELTSSLVDLKEEHSERVNSIYAQFADEKELLIQQKKEYESKFNISKLSLKLENKEEKLKQLQDRFSTIRDEFETEVSKYKEQLKSCKHEALEYKKKFELQQDELDNCNAVIIEKQTQINILTDALQSLQEQNEEEILTKYLEQSAELCVYKAVNSKLENEIQLCFKKLKSKQDEWEDLSKEVLDLKDKIELDQTAYETLAKEVESITNDFELLESDKDKANSEIKTLSKKAQTLEQKLSKKTEEVKLLKTHLSTCKKQFDEKLVHLKKIFNNKIVEYAKFIYPNMVDKKSIVFEDSFVQSKSNVNNSVLRMSHLANSRVRPEEAPAVENTINSDSKLVSQIIDLMTENSVLQMKVIESDAKIKEDALNLHYLHQIELLNQHLQYYKSLAQENDYVEEYVVTGINQQKEFENYKLMRELAVKTKRVTQLEKRISKLEKFEQMNKLQTYQDKVDVDMKIQQEIELQNQSINEYAKNHLTSLLSSCTDSRDVIEKLQKQILGLKKQEQVLSGKLASLTVIKEKLQLSNEEMMSVVKTHEKEIQSLRSQDSFEQNLDKYLTEIETLKHRISKYETERRDLLKKLNQEIEAKQRFEKQVYELQNDLQDEEDQDNDATLVGITSKNIMKHSLLHSHPDKTFNMNDLVKQEDKDEEIIALQNKIHTFNQQHIYEIQELKTTMEREINKVLEEKEQSLREYTDKIEELEVENRQVTERLKEMKERLGHAERIIDELEIELVESPIKVVKVGNVQDKEKTKVKRLKKVIPRSQLSESLNPNDTHLSLNTSYSKPKSQIASTDFIVYPSRIVSLLIESKKREAAALIELKRIGNTNITLQDTIDEKENYIRQLEDEISQLQTKPSNRDFDTFGGTKSTREINVIDEENNQDHSISYTDLKHVYERRVKELEKQLSELRNREQEKFTEILCSNRAKSTDIRTNAKIDGYTENFQAMIDCIAVLAYELCEMEIREGSRKGGQHMLGNETSMTGLQSNRTFTQGWGTTVAEPNNPVEICQRMVIKYLSKTLTRLLENNDNLVVNSQAGFAPNDEGDRAVWYLELLESQIDITDRTLKALKDFTEKISIQVSGSLSSAAQVKATSIELASNTKTTAQEVAQLKNVVKLIHSDLQALRGDLNRDTIVTQGETFARVNADNSSISCNASNIFELNEAEKLRHKLKALQVEKDKLDNLLQDVQNLFSEKLNYETLKSKIEGMFSHIKQLEAKVVEHNFEYDKVRCELDHYMNTSRTLEKQNEKLLNQNAWLEKQIEQLKNESVSQDNSIQKIGFLEKDISVYKQKSEDVLKQKDKKINELEMKILQLEKTKELINLDYIKLQKSHELQSSSKLSDRPSKKVKVSLQDAKKIKKTKKSDVKYHSDSEDISDLTSSRLSKDIKKVKTPGLKQKIKELELEIEDKENLIKHLSTENESLKRELEENFDSRRDMKYRLDHEFAALEDEYKSLNIKYERLLLDHNTEDKSESDQLLQIKSDHARLTVENDWLIREVEKLKNRGFNGQDSVMQMVDDIERTKRELEEQYQSEIEELQQTRQNEKSNYENTISVLTENIRHMEEQKQDLVQHFESVKLKLDKLDEELTNKDSVIEQQANEIQELQERIEDKDKENLEAVESLKNEIDEIRESNKRVIQLYEHQNECFKERVAREIEYLQSKTQNADIKDDYHGYSSLLNDLAQRDAVWKTLKEENKELKLENSKLKLKSKETKLQPLKDVSKTMSSSKASKTQTKKPKSSTGHKLELEPQVDFFEDCEKYSIAECQQILKRASLLEAENLKLTNELHILNKQLLDTTEAKEELLEQVESLHEKSELQKSKKASTKKELTSLTKKHREEVQKLQEEIKSIKATWADPDKIHKMQKREKDLETQIKGLKEDLVRKRDLVSSLKATQEKTEKEAEELVTKFESKKEDIDRIAKLNREIARKETMIRELKSQLDEAKDSESKLHQEVKNLQSKLKATKSDLLRKETMLKETKEKLESEIKEIKDNDNKTIELSKHKEILKKYKQDIERKELKISSLESKLETNASELEKLKSENAEGSKIAKSEVLKESKKYETTVKKMKKIEDTTQTAMIVIRRMIKEMILSVEKLRSDVLISKHEASSRYHENYRRNDTTMHTPLKRTASKSDAYNRRGRAEDHTISDMYKESLDILGVSLGELEEFVQPSQSSEAYNKLPGMDSQDPSCVSSSKDTVGPGLKFEDLGVPWKDNRDLDVFGKVLDVMVEDPQKLLTDSEDVIQIFKKLLKEIKSLEAALSVNKSHITQALPTKRTPNASNVRSGGNPLEDYMKGSNDYFNQMFK